MYHLNKFEKQNLIWLRTKKNVFRKMGCNGYLILIIIFNTHKSEAINSDGMTNEHKQI